MGVLSLNKLHRPPSTHIRIPMCTHVNACKPQRTLQESMLQKKKYRRTLFLQSMGTCKAGPVQFITFSLGVVLSLQQREQENSRVSSGLRGHLKSFVSLTLKIMRQILRSDEVEYYYLGAY